MKLRILILLTAIAYALTGCALVEPGGVSEQLGVTETVVKETPRVDVTGAPVLNEHGQQIVDVETHTELGPAPVAVAENLGGPWGAITTGALGLLSVILGVVTKKKSTRLKRAEVQAARSSRRAKKQMQDSMEYESALHETIVSINAADVADKVKFETAKRLPPSNTIRARIKDVAHSA